MNEIIVARYEEDVKWTTLLSGLKVITYNKKEGENLLPNIGREAHTYLWHITTHWDDLGETTFFSQGDPFFHNREILATIAKYNLPQIPFTPLVEAVTTCDPSGNPDHSGLPIREVWKTLFKPPCPETIVFHKAAIFAVGSSVIKKRPLNFYQKILDLFETAPNLPWVIERLWGYIFSEHLISEQTLFPIKL